MTYRSPCVNTLIDLAKNLDELANAQGQAKKSNAGSNEASTKAPTPLEALIPLLVPFTFENLFTKFMKMFMETTQARDQEQLKLQERSLKVRTPKTCFGKSHMDCYYFY